MSAPAPVSPADIDFRRLGPDLCDILLRGRYIGTFERIPDLASADQRHVFRITILSDPEAPRDYPAVEKPRRTIAQILNAACDTAGPPPVHLQCHICEHRAGSDEVHSRLIRRDRFLDPAKADAYFDLVGARLKPGEFVALRFGGNTLRLVHADAIAA